MDPNDWDTYTIYTIEWPPPLSLAEQELPSEGTE